MPDITIDPGTLAAIDLGNEIGLDLATRLEQHLADDAPVRGPIPGATSVESDRATTIWLPTLAEGHTYYLNRPVRVPDNKNVRIAATAPRGARLRAGDAVPYSLVSGGGNPNWNEADVTPDEPVAGTGAVFRTHIFENLVLHRAGVLIEGNARGETAFLSCAFHNIDNWEPPLPPTERWGIRTGDRGVVGVRVIDCLFSHMTGGGVLIGHTECDNWLIGDNSRFVRLGLPGVETRSPSTTIRSAQFETKLKKFGEEPYIRVTSSAGFGGGGTSISHCRFGGEKSEKYHGPPTYCVDLDPKGRTITSVSIEHNWFAGHTPATGKKNGPPVPPCPEPETGTADSARSAIRITKTAHLVNVIGNVFRAFQYHDQVIEEAELVGDPGPGANTFVGNQLDLRIWDPQKCAFIADRRTATPADIFVNGGEGWSVWP